MSAESIQIKHPILVFFFGLYFAILMEMFVLILLAGFEVFTQIVIWEPNFSCQKFFMMPYPLHFNILSTELVIYLFMFLWLGYSIPSYFIVKKKHKDQLLGIEVENCKNSNINNRVDKLEQSVERILNHLNNHIPNHLSDNDDH